MICINFITFLPIVVFIALIITGKSIKGQVIGEYIGCYHDDRNDTEFSGYTKVAVNITAGECNVFCFRRAFLQAAIRDRRECKCGNLEVLPEPNHETLCDIDCGKGNRERCGGKRAYSVYSTGIKEDDVDDLDELEIGCLEEKDEIRLIKEHKVDLPKTNSPLRCVAYCKALGYPYAGLQYARECYCGWVRRTYPRVFGCNMRCSGNPKEKCGGRWRLMIYSTGIARPPPGIEPKGCYQQSNIITELRYKMEQMDRNMCISYCYVNKYLYAHLHNGTECLCGRKKPRYQHRSSQAQCDIDCPGRPEKKCGGELYVTTYTTGILGEPSLGKMIGCYNDEQGDFIKGPKLNLGKENSISRCISECIELGYAFAALRNIYDCHCSQTSPNRIPVRIVPDDYCNSPCPHSDHQLEQCGAPLFTALYRTGFIYSDDACMPTISKFNERAACRGELLFSDNFESLDLRKWQHSVKISGEDGEFVTYTSKKKNIYTEDGKLIIRPTTVSDKFVKYGQINLKRCTGESNTTECSMRAMSHQILPPIESGQICTKNSFSFRYGNVTVGARMSKGDWLVPQIWLKPSKEIYGPGYISGKIIVVRSRGNTELTDPDRKRVGSNLVESGFQQATDKNKQLLSKLASIASSDAFYSDFMEYSMEWTPDKIRFHVIKNSSLLEEKTLSTPRYSPIKSLNNTKYLTTAPFDQEFHLCLGLSVGGIHHFPDDFISTPSEKPWKNTDVKGLLHFWQNRSSWLQTWSNHTRFEIDYIRVKAAEE